MYVLIVSRGYPTERYKMNGIFEFDQARALNSIGIKVVFGVIDLRSFRRVRKFGRETLEKDGIRVEALNIPCGTIPKSLLYRIGEVGTWILYKRIERKYGKPDIIHSHFTQIGYFVSRVLKKYKIPLVLTEHSSLLHNKEIDKGLYSIAKYTYDNSNKLITVSTSLANSICRKFGTNAITIPNIVDTDIFHNKSVNINGQFNIISTGSLIKTKRMGLLLDAFSKAFPNNPDICLYIFGEGPERAQLEDKINIYNLNKRVYLMGIQPRHVIAEYLQKSSCFALVSKSETFGVAYIEALSVGVPVIATKCGGPEDYINSSNGLLVEKDNIDSISEALIYIYNNTNWYDRKKISEEAKRQFSHSTIAKKIENVYIEMLQERKS